ncbi:fumarylacetoacetate hydrolase family protein [Paenarthrobacter sp. DKR-5]|uniref:fumarylacetoacetate hydrolase family protein n=1 Tax=Paenarthrobacter sp. DKR-5 TaxID=2835535 RepID=UPI001BDD9160|nr:fumarylacetoacetate hydrolase family protein [Paenarthrobacter sp. DKR-5]MBT1001539.1 fumarylacetoacetate hydrolase family protein [Paenarthrobacter sp. DKR-5]
MELMRLGEAGKEIPVATADGKFFDLRPVTADIDGGFLARGGIAQARAALAAGLPELHGAEQLRVGAPVAKPGAVLCIGQNYAAHAAESGDVPPSTPILFFKHPNTVVGPYDKVVIPPNADKVDWEVELAVVIGKRASYLSSPEEALDYVAGYAASNDVSERAFQVEHSGGQWSKGKSCETFNPLGPALVPAEEVGDPQQLRLRSAVNGEVRQDSSTSDMIFSVAHIVWHLSQYLVLDPGDIINTGTPQGVALSGRFPYLKHGDRMEISIEKLGHQEQELVGAGQ